jgi:alpha-galactosidase
MPTHIKKLSLIVAVMVCGAAIVLRGSSASAPRETRSGTDSAGQLAPTPPMGWNSWDSYGTSIDEKQFRANASWMTEHLKSFGWQYVVIDEGWYLVNPTEQSSKNDERFSLDEFGRYTPDLARFPSAANSAGFKPLADYIHSLGLKFGIHILRGIPKAAVLRNLPIANSEFHASDAAVQSDLCPWNDFNFGADPARAGPAYYGSIAKLYADWGVDFVKVDCIASRPYKDDEVRMIGTALQKAGRPIVVSLSPGEAPIEKIDDLRRYSQLWRISDDIWDRWHSTADFPQGVRDQFPRAAKWAALAEPGHWPDADMLPIGNLRPSPGWGQPRQTRLTHDEQRTLLTLWCMFRSPLMMGGDLVSSDEWTASLLTNPEVIAVDQHSTANHAVVSNDKEALWWAHSEASSDLYVAAFNLEESSRKFTYEWSALRLPDKRYAVRDLWTHEDLGPADSLRVTLAPHASALYRLSSVSDK